MNHLDWALMYAGIGWYVFPVHSPIIDSEGTAIGCTCEYYRQSEECKEKHPHLYLRPDQHCPQPGKCPVGRWSEISTLDPDVIRKWWSEHPIYNIGIDCGKSDLLVFDADTYKQFGDLSDLLDWKDRQTVTAITGGGGEHLIYKRNGKPYGNSSGNLPAGIDIRGNGGYIVASPSLHKSGRRYQWEDEFSPFDIKPLPIPLSLDTILSQAKGNTGYSDAPLNSEALVDSVVYVERIFAQADIAHYGRKDYGQGVKWILQQCPFNPPEDPHADDQAAFVIIYPDGKISAGCHHARCQERINQAESGWRLFRDLTHVTGESAKAVTVQYQVQAILASDEPNKAGAIAALQSEIDSAPPDVQALISKLVTPNDNQTRIAQIGFSNMTDYQKRQALMSLNGSVTPDDLKLAEDLRIIKPGETLEHRPSITHYDHGGFAQYFHEKYPNSFIHNDAFGWMRYTGTHWTKSGAKDILARMIEDVLRECAEEAIRKDSRGGWKQASEAAAENGNVTGTMALYSSRAYIATEEIDAHPDLLNCPNGIVDLRTGELMPHDPAKHITHCTRYEYDPDADQSFWVNWLNETVGEELAAWLQVAVGYTLTGHTSEECMFYVYGPTRAGKGTFTETLMHLLPGPFAKEVDFSTFTAKRDGDSQNFDLAALAPCRAIFASESKSYERLNEAKVKAMTGGNMVRCAHKHKEHFEYRPMYKIWLSANPAVNADPDDDAVWYRIHIAHFPNSKAGKEDTTLKFKMKSEAVQKGVLAWAVAGAIRWYKEGLRPLQSQIDIKTQQRNDLDHISEWITQNCVQGGFTSNDDLYTNYAAWCKENGVIPKMQKGLTQSLLRKNYTSVQKWVSGKNKRCVMGISLVGSTRNAVLDIL